ncbi:hypothetical protein [Kibdelosporangium aridum]|uniref:Uncharacterized protein n=1 Tax=Kibdelosporangium aridum TaxID=2030 RepID=A0A1W2EFW7_KIBAR|nr:hypothetical protein [Kibdelosporangium aridum]SMD08535.1 hypothetical protein SAMN05661093_04329 [Kibdelosporangium aridum]
MFRRSAILAAALALVATPAASADEGQLEVQLEPGFFMTIRDGILYGSDYVSYNEFSIKVKALEATNEVKLFVSLPYEVHVDGHEGDGWTCWDVEGGIDCTNTKPALAGAELPSLLVRINPDCENTLRDSFDVYSEGTHRYGIPFICYPTGT